MKKIRQQIKHKNTNKLLNLIILLSLVFIAVSTVNAVSAADSTIYVNDSGGNDDWNGQFAEWIVDTINGPKKSIKNAIETVAEGGTVNIADGTYTGENNTGITINKNMTIQGQSREGTIIDAQGQSRIFTVAAGKNVTIQNLTFTNGYSSYGGAIRNDGILTVKDSKFINNRASTFGGAVGNYGTLTVKDSTFEENRGNEAGGAIGNFGGTLNVIASIFLDNYSDFGGAIHNGEGTLTVTGSTFAGNTAGLGGAIHSYGAPNRTLTITGCNFDHNTANSDGGAIYCWIGYETFSNVTVKYSRFVGNKVGEIAQDIAIYEGALDARYNWWGNNNGPEPGRVAGRGSHTIANVIDYTPWLVLTINANPSTIDAGKTSKITANVYTDSNGVDHSVDASLFFSGPEITFTTDLGNVGSKTVTVPWTLGSAFAILRGDEGPGLATLTAADIQTVQTLVNILQGSNPVDPEDPVDPGDSEDPTNPLDPVDPEDPVDQPENSTTTVNAATETSKTIKMQETGLPLVGLVLAVLMLFGGLATSKK